VAHSKEYLDQLRKLHKKTSFGSGREIPRIVSNIIEKQKIESFLDFGSGKGLLSNKLCSQYPDLTLYTYDPVTSPIELPDTVDMIYSSDVLEHIEPVLLDETLADLFNRATTYQYHLIACHPAKKHLADGRNAHLIIETPEWWKKKLSTFGWTVEFEETKTSVFDKRGLYIDIIKYITVLKK
jgi:hypothetical protein